MASGRGHGSMVWSMKFIRFLIVLFSLSFVIVGLALLAIGAYVVKDPKMQQLRPLLNPDITSSYSQSLSNLEVFAYALIAIGGVLLIVGFLGCCGAIKGFRFLHVLYAVVIGAVIIAEIAIIVVFVTYQNQFRAKLITRLQTSINASYVGPPTNNYTTTNPVSLSWDFAQFNLQCCGAVSQSDFSLAPNWSRANPYQAGANLTIPFTCCPVAAAKSWTQLPTNFSSASTCATTGAGSYQQGCYDRLRDIVATYKRNVIIGGAIIGTVEVLAFIFAILLYRRKESYENL